MPTDLTTYPRPSVAVDLALMTVEPATDESPARLVTLVLAREADPVGHVLPGRFVRERATISETVADLLVEKLNLSPSLGGASPRLLRVFDDPERDERSWTLSIAHMVCLPWEYVAAASGEWIPVGGDGRLTKQRRLLFDHDLILKDAVSSIRDRYETEPDPDRLLATPFTLLELRRLHEAVLGEALLKDTFNRRMRPQLSESNDLPDKRPVGRPASYYQHGSPTAGLTDSLWRLPRSD